MTIEEIKAALFDGATVRVVGVDYVDTYSTWTSPDGLYMHAYCNDDDYTFGDMFAAIARTLSRAGVRVFLDNSLDMTITIIIGIGDEV